MKNIRLPSHQDNLHALIGFVSGLAEKCGFPAKRVKEVELAAEETLVNILTYAYPKSVGEVDITCKEESSSRLIFEITDWGDAFDPLSLPVPDLLAELAIRRVGGLGVFLVRQMADRIEYRRQGDTNVLTLTFTPQGPKEQGE